LSRSDRSRSELGLDLSGLRLNLEGLGGDLVGRLTRDWPAFVTVPADCPFLHLSIEIADDVAASEEAYAPKEMRSALAPGRARYWMPEGSAEVDSSGTSRIRLTCGGGRSYYTLINMLRASLAWSLPSRGGALLHAAGLALGQRAFLLVGPEGSGKSTWARLGEREGAHVISDDLVLIDGIGSTFEVLGTPFRSTHVSRLEAARWPLAAILFPRHGAEAALAPLTSVAVRSRLLANLPFVAEGIERDSRIEHVLERLATGVVCRELTFGRDGSFVELLRQWSTGERLPGRAES